jgi:hypothetical protein
MELSWKIDHQASRRLEDSRVSRTNASLKRAADPDRCSLGKLHTTSW